MAERLLFLWILLGAVFAAFVCSIIQGVIYANGSPAAAEEMSRWAGAILFPWMAYLLSFSVIWFMTCGIGGPVERTESRRLMLTLAFLMLAYLVVSTAITGPPPPDDPRSTPAGSQGGGGGGALVAALGQWLLLIGFVFVFFARYVRRAPLRAWTAQPHLHRPQTLELTPHGLRFDDGCCTRDYRWEGFPKWREGETIFLLYVSDVAFHTVPKRAFPTVADVDGFRHLLQHHVHDVDHAVGQGFPVHARIPRQSAPPPLPVQPH
jgi:hypothetical protein